MEWQPIETLVSREQGPYVIVTGERTVPVEIPYCFGDEGDRDLWDLTRWNYDGNDIVDFAPTHWMPLPPLLAQRD